MRRCSMSWLALVLALTEPSGGQVLDLDGTAPAPGPPALGMGTYAADLARRLEQEMTDLAAGAEGSGTVTEAIARGKIKFRQIAARLLEQGDRSGPAGSTVVLAGMRLARGRAGLEANRRDIIRYLWDTWSPGWQYTDAAYDRSAPSFDNPDFVDVVIHSYRHRHGNAPGEERFLAVERQLAERPQIPVPAIVLRGAESGFGRPSADPSGDQRRFTSLVAHRIVDGAGHDLPAHRPDAVSSALLELLT